MQSISLVLGTTKTIPVNFYDAGGASVPPPVPATYSFVSDDGSVGEFHDVATLVVTPGNVEGTSIDIGTTNIGHQRARGVSGSLSADLMIFVTGPAASMSYGV